MLVTQALMHICVHALALHADNSCQKSDKGQQSTQANGSTTLLDLWPFPFSFIFPLHLRSLGHVCGTNMAWHGSSNLQPFFMSQWSITSNMHVRISIHKVFSAPLHILVVVHKSPPLGSSCSPKARTIGKPETKEARKGKRKTEN